MRSPLRIARALSDRLTLRAHSGPIGIGLIGIGGWGASNAVNIMRSRRFSVLGVQDVRAELAQQFAQRFRTNCYRQAEELLSQPNVQAVCITVPNPFHADLVKAASDAGKHVFIEKPLASSAAVCRELGQYCEERRVLLQVGHQMRREPAFRAAKGILDTGVLGRPLFAQAVCTLDRRNREDWRSDPDSCPGGSMEQLGVHLIDVLIYLFGLPRQARGWTTLIPSQSGTPDWRCVSATFDQDVQAIISTSFSSPAHTRLELFFEKGQLTTNGHTLWLRDPQGTRTLTPKGIPGGVVQFIEFADCIEQGGRPATGATEAAAVMEVVNSLFDREEGIAQ